MKKVYHFITLIKIKSLTLRAYPLRCGVKKLENFDFSICCIKWKQVIKLDLWLFQ